MLRLWEFDNILYMYILILWPLPVHSINVYNSCVALGIVHPLGEEASLVDMYGSNTVGQYRCELS